MIIRHPKMNQEGAAAGGGGADPNAPIIAAAEQAVAQAKVAVAAAEAKAEAERVARVALEAKLTAAEAKPATPTAPTEAVSKFEAFVTKDYNKRRLAHARAIGLVTKTDDGREILSDDEVLKHLPDADPDTADGAAKFETFRQSRPGLFKTPGLSQASVLAAMGDGLSELSKKSPLFNHDKLVGSVFGGKA